MAQSHKELKCCIVCGTQYYAKSTSKFCSSTCKDEVERYIRKAKTRGFECSRATAEEEVRKQYVEMTKLLTINEKPRKVEWVQISSSAGKYEWTK